MGSGSSKKKKLVVTAEQKWKKKKGKIKATNYSREEEAIRNDDEEEKKKKAVKDEEEEEKEEEKEEKGEGYDDDDNDDDDEDDVDDDDNVDDDEDEDDDEDDDDDDDDESEDDKEDDGNDESEEDNDNESGEGGVAINLTDYSEKMQKALVGGLDIEFPENVKVVRIFTSSTFTDTSIERNTLMVQVYPRIKKFCQERGYEFQVVDMRWGVRDESTDDHLTSQLCMKELRACQKLSTGPNFITFLGQKYGYRPFPPKILASEFEILLRAVDDQDDIELLKLWFVRDDNTVPPEYLLQPITSVLPDYRNYGNPELRKQASGKWWAAFERMQIVLRKAADKVLTNKPDDRLKYYMSVTEDEIRRGIINAKSPATHTFWFKRVITDINEHISDTKVGSFMDKTWVTLGEVDKEAQSLLNTLREKDLPKAIPNKNVIQYNVKWTKNGIDPDASSEHAQYIKKLCNDFYDKLTEMISSGIAENETADTREPLAEEIFQHLSFCQKKCKAFFGRKDFLESIKDGLLHNGKRTIVLHGESGCGKTSLMAKVATDVKSWFEGESVLMVCRFIGTSPESSSIRPLLRSLCQQLCKMSGETTNIPEDIKSLVEFSPECLDNASQDMKLVLVLDSLDQLSVDDSGRLLDWLPRDLPDNVYAVLSTLPGEHYQCLPSLKMKLPKESFMKVPQMPLNEADIILDNWLKAAKRALQPKQRHELIISFQECPLPLYLRLAFDESRRWKSYTPSKEWDLPPNVKDIILGLFDRVERIHGKVLVGHALGYITASKNGLTETELEDVLSLDDDVLNDVYQYWTPPIRRLPPLLWIRIRSDIKDYLIDRGADDTRVIYWYHRQFIEVARERYLVGEQAKKIHANLSEYFLGSWAEGKKKPYVNKKGEKHSDDRLVAGQPMMFDTSDEKPIFNLRKLSELPYHLIRSIQLGLLKEKVLFNFGFLLTKIRAKSIDVVLEDFDAALNAFPDDVELDTLDKTLRLSAVALRTDPRQLATQLIGRLLESTTNSDEFPNMISLIKDAYTSPVPCLIPSQKCLSSPGGALVASLGISEGALHCCAFSCDGKTAYLGSTTSDGLQIQAFQLQSGKVQRKMKLTDPFEMAFTWSMKGSEKNIHFLLIMGSKYIFLINTQTGTIMQQFHALEEETRYEPMPPVSFADNEDRIVAITDKDLKIWTVADGMLRHSLAVGKINTDEQYGSLDAHQNLAAFCLRESKVIKILDVRTGKYVREVQVFTQDQDRFVHEAKIVSNEKLLAVSSSLKCLRLYDLHGGTLSKEIKEFSINPGLHRLQLTKDRRKALSIVQYEVMITDLESGEIIQTLKSKSLGTLVIHTDLFTRDGRFVISIANDNILRIYDVRRSIEEDKTAQNISSLKNAAVASSDTVTGLFPGVDGRHIIATANVQMSSEISVWDCKSGAKLRAIKCGLPSVLPQELRMCSPTRGVGFIHDVNLLHYKVFDFKQGRVERCLLGKASKRTKAFGCVDENHIIAFSRGRRNLKVWNINTGKVTKQYIFGQKHQFEEMLISQNGRMVVCAQVSTTVEHSEDKTLPIVALDTNTGQHRLLEIQKKKLCLTFSALSRDGTYLVCPTNDLKPRLWNLKTGELLHKLEDKEYPIAYATAISVPLQLALTAQSDGNINAWKIESGRILHTFTCETVDIILISEDGHVAYSRYRYRNSNIDAWDLINGNKLATFTSDWKPERVDIVGNTLVLGMAEAPKVMTLKLHSPNDSGHIIDDNGHVTSIFHGITVDGIISSCPDSPSLEDGDKDLDDDDDKTDIQKTEFTRKALLARPNVIIAGGSLVDSKNVFISESVFKQNFSSSR